MFYGDYHTHTKYSDGVSTIKENIQAALEKGLKELAFTDHGFSNPSCGSLTRETFIKQRVAIEKERILTQGKLTIYHGVEADIIGLDGTIDLEEGELSDMEILVMGYHSFSKAKSFYDWRKIFGATYKSMLIPPSKKVIQRNTKAMIDSIKRYPIDILAHINHLFKVDCVEVSKCCADYGTYIELNNKHMNLSDEDFQRMLDTGVEFVASSDAHHFSRIGNFEKITKFLTKHNLDKKLLMNYDKKPDFPRKKGRIKEL